MPAEPGDFGLTLTILRLSRGWSQDRVAKATGLTNSALSEYEHGKKVPELKSLQKIVTALGYRLSAIERTEDFLRELRMEGCLEARLEEDGSSALVPLSRLIPTGDPEDAARLRFRARRVAAQMGQAATGFSLLLFEVLIGRERGR